MRLMTKFSCAASLCSNPRMGVCPTGESPDNRQLATGVSRQPQSEAPRCRGVGRLAGSVLVKGLVLAGFLLGGIVPAHARDASMISISVPPANEIMKEGSVDVTIRLSAPADPSHLQVQGNNADITEYFDKTRCYSAPCEISARLNANVVTQGWNYMYATVEGPNASTDSASAQFYNDRGVTPTDATTGYAPSFSVHVHATDTKGLEVDYAPGIGNVPTYYPNSSYPGCAYEQLTMLTLNRTSLAPKSVKCFGPNDKEPLDTYLKQLTKDDLVFASTVHGQPLGRLNLAIIGGTDFTAAGAPTAYSYSIIGYGASTPGLAVESYNASPHYPRHGLEGSLINVGSTTAMYAFRSTDAPAFAVQPAESGKQAKITVGYTTSFPIGTGALPTNFILPSQFTNTTYASPACAISCSGGLFTAVFDAYTLQLRWSNTYATNSDRSVDEVNRMAGDLQFHLNSYPVGRNLVIITTVGNPFGTADEWGNASRYPSQQLVDIIQKLGVSGSAFTKLIQGGSFSMIGLPDALPSPGQGVHSITKWYSSTLQAGDTGALRGVLVRDKNFLLSPQDISSFTVDSSITNPTASDLLSFAIPLQIGRAPSVGWPMMDTDGRRKAYAYASDQMNRADFYDRDPCTMPRVQCEDIRARYTSSQLKNITTGINPRDIPFPSDPNAGFTANDLSDVTDQLAREKQYLKSADGYAETLYKINTNGIINVGASLQSSATNVATTLYTVDRSADESALSLVPNIIGTAAAITSIAGVFPPVGIVSGVLGSASSLAGLYNSTKSQPDPEVSKLGDLLAQKGGDASEYAYKFNTALQASTGMYFNDVYSDWFKLQTVGLMTVTPGSGWYYETVGNALTDYNRQLISNARTSFYEQAAPQYFAEIRLHRIARSYYLEHGETQATLDKWAAEENAGFPPRYLSRAFVYDYSPTPGYPRCIDYVYMVNKSSVKNGVKVPARNGTVDTWPDTFGTTLMGPVDPATSLGNLGLPRDFFYDTSGYSVVLDTNPRLTVKGECGVQ